MNQFNVPQQSQQTTGKNLLYLSDLPQHITEEDIRFFFKDYIDNVAIINISNTTRFDYTNRAPTATVIFKDYEIADKARRDLNMRKLRGKTVRLMWHERDNSIRHNPQTNIFIKNIPINVSPRQFYEHFSAFGDIVSAKLPENDDGNHQGYGYINYYNAEDARKAIETDNGKEVWGSPLEVQVFQRMNERGNISGVGSQQQNSLHIKNFPSHFKEEDVSKLCESFGNISFQKIFEDTNGRHFAIVAFEKEEDANKAKNELNGKEVEDNELIVENLMTKNERKRFLNSKINESNSRLNDQYRFCNLHIRNIPYSAKEEDLVSAFEVFGPIKSVKVDKYILVTKEGNEMKEIPTSRGFGYICFEDAESAKQAIEGMNNKFLPKYETWNRPLLVDYFMPKNERQHMNKQMVQQTSLQQRGFNPMGMGQMIPPVFNSLGFNPNMGVKQQQNFAPWQSQGYNKGMLEMGGIQGNNMFLQNQQTVQNNRVGVQQVQKEQTSKVIDDIDYEYLQNQEDDYAKKDYLGDLLFKKIENHPLAAKHHFTIDTIGKITGMILGIEDITEILDTCRNYENLTNRINEALELLGETINK
jgi:polyadenylate-binding protein